jgi:hypothetical protein
VRRIPLEKHGVKIKDYGRDLFAENILELSADDTGKNNLVELAEFVTMFAELNDGQLEDEYTELINPYFDKGKAVSMYKRFAAEARTVLGRYRTLAPLLR